MGTSRRQPPRTTTGIIVYYAFSTITHQKSHQEAKTARSGGLAHSHAQFEFGRCTCVYELRYVQAYCFHFTGVFSGMFHTCCPVAAYYIYVCLLSLLSSQFPHADSVNTPLLSARAPLAPGSHTLRSQNVLQLNITMYKLVIFRD